MARRVVAFDWSATPLGPITVWPRSLKTVLAACLRSPFQMAIYWGPELICLYNDAERDVLGQLHPGALGLPARELLRDSWEELAPQLAAVMGEGKSIAARDHPLHFERRGLRELGYFTYSYGPIPDDDGEIGGVLLVSHDTTAHVLSERRTDALRELASRSMDARTEAEACVLAAKALDGRPDLPLTLMYLVDDDGAHATCVAGSGLPRGFDPATMAATLDVRPLARRPDAVVDSSGLLAERRWQARVPGRAFLASLRSSSTDPPQGFLAVGLRDDLAFDDGYRGFLEMVAIGLGRSVDVARARRAERDRTRDIATLDSARIALFSNASHELRTPLALILGAVEQLLDGDGLDTQAIEALDVARRSALRMIKLVNALLDVSRIEAGEQIGMFQATDLARLTREVTAMFRSTAERAGLTLSVDCPPLRRSASVDREAWERIVSNLLSNAVKYTPEGGVSVRMRRESDDAVLIVEDTGIGVAETDLERIFSRFYRVADRRARTSEGTGIGLALVRKLAELHGGSVHADSRLGGGTRMMVRVPLRGRTGEGARRSGGVPAVAVGRAAAAFIAEAEGWLGRSGDGPGGHHRHRASHVLIVDDNADMRAYLRRLLEPDYVVASAADGDEALKMALSDPPAVVISDVMLPGLDGLALLEALRAQTATRDTPVILLSARADKESTLHALELGADDYIVKPFGARELVARIRTTAEASRRRSQSGEARGRAQERALKDRELRALLNELKAAQRRVVTAGDAERRRIERDLHDGAQQGLMAIRLELGLLAERLEGESTGAHADVQWLMRALDTALDELRELAHGLYPPLLASDGLHAALSGACRRAPVPATLEGSGVGRVPSAIESAVYFCCVEALQNVAKHAGAGAHASVRLEARRGAIEFSVRDDGAGFDERSTPAGQGLTNVRDRLAALGGHADLVSLPGGGTTVSGLVPVP